MELWIDEQLLNKFERMTRPGEELEHRGLNALLRDLQMLGYLHRDEHKIEFQNGNKTTLDEDYIKYLDRKASGLVAGYWEDMDNDSESSS